LRTLPLGRDQRVLQKGPQLALSAPDDAPQVHFSPTAQMPTSGGLLLRASGTHMDCPNTRTEGTSDMASATENDREAYGPRLNCVITGRLLKRFSRRKHGPCEAGRLYISSPLAHLSALVLASLIYQRESLLESSTFFPEW
jgi:hypothetical protein